MSLILSKTPDKHRPCRETPSYTVPCMHARQECILSLLLYHIVRSKPAAITVCSEERTRKKKNFPFYCYTSCTICVCSSSSGSNQQVDEKQATFRQNMSRSRSLSLTAQKASSPRNILEGVLAVHHTPRRQNRRQVVSLCFAALRVNNARNASNSIKLL